MFVLAPSISFGAQPSIKIKRLASTLPCNLFHCSRRRATSWRSCSLARRLFFKAEAGVLEEMPHAVIADVHFAFVQFSQQLSPGDIGLLCKSRADPFSLLCKRERLLAAHRQRGRTAGRRRPPDPSGHRGIADLIAVRSSLQTHARGNRRHNTLSQIQRIGSTHTRWPPSSSQNLESDLWPRRNP